MTLRRAILLCTLAACVALLPTSAAARLSVRVPAERSVADRVADALSDGELGAGDLVDEAFNELWNAIGNTIAEAQICREANAELLSSSRRPATFGVDVTITGGSADSTIAVRMSAMPQGNQVIVKVLKTDGSVVREIPCPKPWGLTVDDDAPSAATLETRGGAEVLAFQTEYGRIITYLPSDMRAGDRISGTVYVEPNGEDDAARRANAGRLSGYVVDVGGVRTRVAEGVFGVTLTTAAIEVALRRGNRVVLEAVIQPAPQQSAVGGLIQPNVPSVTQAGQPASIQGPFDGDVSNTQAQLGDQPAIVVAESPREAIILCPPSPTGPTIVHVNDGGRVIEGQTHNIGVSLSTPVTTLPRGARTQLTLRVTGLQGLQERVDVALWASPSVDLQGGNTQTVMINPGDANSAGEMVRQYQLQVLTPGPFEVTATLTQP